MGFRLPVFCNAGLRVPTPSKAFTKADGDIRRCALAIDAKRCDGVGRLWYKSMAAGVTTWRHGIKVKKWVVVRINLRQHHWRQFRCYKFQFALNHPLVLTWRPGGCENIEIEQHVIDSGRYE